MLYVKILVILFSYYMLHFHATINKVILQVFLMSLLCLSKDDVTFKIIIKLIINYH
jgi:hypothetical protein